MNKLKFAIIIILVVLCNTVNAFMIYNEPMTDVYVETVVEEVEEDTYISDIIAKVNEAFGQWTLAEAIVVGCVNHSNDINLCIEHVFGVATAESGLFKKTGTSNNGFGRMYNGTKKRFSSIEEGIIQRIKLYEKNNRASRTTGDRRIAGNYCSSGCEHWIKNYNSGVAKAKAILK